VTKVLTAPGIQDILQQSQVLLGSIIHSAMDAIIVVDEDQNILIFNPASEKMFRRSADEVKGKPLALLIPERFRAGHIRDVRNFGRTAKTSRTAENLGSVVGLRSTGEEFPLEVSISQAEVGGRKFFTAILHDITERRQAEKDLQGSLKKAERSQTLLLALSQAANAVQKAHTADEIGRAILDGLAGLGYQVAILLCLPQDPGHLVVSNLSHAAQAIKIIEKMIGAAARDFRLPLMPGGLFDRVLSTGEAEFSLADLSLYESVLPKNLRPLAGRMQKLLGIHAGITARLTRGNEIYGLLTVAGDDLDAADLPAMTTFAAQASIALDNVRLLETVRQKEEHFRLLVEQLPAITYQDVAQIDSVEFTTAFISSQVQTLLGYPAEDFISDPGLWNRLIHPDDRDRVVKLNAEHYLTRQPNRDEYRMFTRQGEVIWVRDESFIITSQDDGKLLSQGVVLDITERKQAEEAQRISEKRFSGAFEYAAIGMGLVAIDGRWLRVNRALCELLGYTKEELLETSYQDITHPDDLETDLAFVHQLLAGEIQSYQMEKRYFQRSGQVVWVLLNVSLIRDEQGQPLYFISQIENITDRKQAEENLRESETRYRSLFEDSPISLWEQDFSAVKQRLDRLREEGITDFQAYFTSHPETVADCAALVKVVDVNTATLRMYGADQKEALFDGLSHLIGDESLHAFQAELINIAQGKTSFGWEGSNRTLDGRRIDVALNWSAAPGFEHSLSKVIISILDITERKQAGDMLMAERDLLTTLINTLPDNIFIKDVMGRVVIDNTAHQRALGADSLEQVVGKSDFDFFSGEQAAGYDADEKQVLRSAQPLIDKVEPYIDKNNDQRWLLTTKVPLRDRHGNITGIVGFNHDITDRKEADEKLAEERNLLRTLIDNLPDRIMVMDTQGRKTLSNLADWQASGGKTMEDVIGKTDLDMYPPELAGEFWALDRSVLETGKPVINHEEGGLDASGNPVWVLSTKVPLRDANGKVVGLVGIGRDITERKQAEQRIQRQLQRLAALRNVDQVVTSSFDLRNSLGMILTQVTRELGVDAADVLLLNSTNLYLEYCAGAGFRTKLAEKAHVRLGQSYAGRVALERQMVQIMDLKDQSDALPLNTYLAGEDFVCYCGVPLIAKGVVKGVLEVYHRSPLHPDQEWLDFLNTLAGQAALAIDNASLFDNLQRSNTELTLAYDATIEGWSHAMDLRDKETEGHTLRVTEITMELAGLFGTRDDDLVNLRRGALLHDIGKMGVPDAILLKPAALTEEEWIIMRKHPTFAFEMLSPIHYLRSALDIPYCHHEKWDGTGYPRGLKGEQIPLQARIFAIVDVWDALTSDRPYRKAWSKEKTMDYLRSESGKQFDPQVLQICLQSGVFDRKSRN
jgi:PAS domain S-box-containing protein